MNYWWSHWTRGTDGLPPLALLAGIDLDGSKMYVARAFHAGDLMPGKYIPSKHKMYICWDGEEYLKDEFEVLSTSDACWVFSSDGEIHPDAVCGGHTKTGEKLFVGRGIYNDCLTPGKVHPSHKSLYIPFDGAERRIRTSYEILVKYNYRGISFFNY